MWDLSLLAIACTSENLKFLPELSTDLWGWGQEKLRGDDNCSRQAFWNEWDEVWFRLKWGMKTIWGIFVWCSKDVLRHESLRWKVEFTLSLTNNTTSSYPPSTDSVMCDEWFMTEKYSESTGAGSYSWNVQHIPPSPISSGSPQEPVFWLVSTQPGRQPHSCRQTQPQCSCVCTHFIAQICADPSKQRDKT